jgi:transposase
MIITTSARSWSLKRRIILNYALAVVLAAASEVVAFALFPSWASDAALLLLLSVVMFAGLVAGPGPAALASALTFLFLRYYLFPPSYSFVLQSSEILRLGLFIVASMLVVLLSAAPKKSPGVASTATFLADKAFDADERVIEPLLAAGKTFVIPPKSNRKVQRLYDKELYKARHLMENFYCKLKQYRAIATRYDKTARNFLAGIQLAAAVIWLN